VVALVGERHSPRAMCRIKRGKLEPVLHGLDRAGHQAAAVRHHFMRGLPLTQAPIDALWTLIKRTRLPFKLVLPMRQRMPGAGEPSRGPVACVVCIIARLNG